jgi:PAS domain S-box-containing protein
VNAELRQKVDELATANGELHESEERFRLLVESVKDYALFMLAADGTVTSWNRGAERLKGYRAEEIVGRHFSRFYTDEDVHAGKPRRILEAARAQGRVEDEGWRVRQDGTRFWASVVLAAIRDEGGNLRGFAKLTRDFTERRATEVRLAYLASFPEKNPNPIVEADVEGRVRYANPAALRLFPDILQEGSAHPWLAGWEPAARSILEGRAAPGRRVVTVGDQSYHQALAYAPEEGVVRVYGLDITEQKRTEEALRESEERLRRAQEISHVGSWELDLQRNLLSWSDEVYRLFGLEPQEFAASYEAFLEAVHPEDRAAVDAAYAGSVREGKGGYEIEHRIVRRPTGEIRVVHEKCEHVRDASGRIVKSVGMVHDITERRRAAEAVERSRQGLGRLAAASLSVMARTDLDGMLQAISEAALALSGARIATCGHGLVHGRFIVGGSARVPGAPACRPGDMFRLERGGVHMALVEGAESIRLTDEELRADPRWWGLPEGHAPMRGLLGVRIQARSGRTSGMILVTDKERGDFTEEDEALLKQLATVASLGLQHIEARISLEETDRRKNQFLAMLSHELRNPLAPIRNGLYVLDRAAPGGEQARRAQAVIVRQVGHLTHLVDDLLDVTRISSGKIQLEREPLDLGDLVRHAVEDHRPAFVTRGLELELAIPAGAVRIDGDRTRVAQVIDNLLQNASKFTQPGGRVTVSVEASEALGQAIARVRDTGAGIAPEMLPRLFEPFSQADTTLDRSKGGLGLGLALVKGLVEMHGGNVSVASEGLGRGAEFTIRLPLLSGLALDAAPRHALRRSEPRRVLVIEDNVDAAESLREVLELAGNTVEVAYTGPAGIEKARGFGPDVVLCDVGLPGMDGYEVARALRADPALRSATLAALTGYARPEDVARSREAGFDHHLAKPLSLERLADVLSRPGAGTG